jgi:dihydrofolate synthase/folylpolyglutamate synthase
MRSGLTFASDHFSAEKKSETSGGQIFSIRKDEQVIIPELPVGLKGLYQKKNICTVVQSFEILRQKFSKLNFETLERGAANVTRNTGLRGRWDILSESPLIVADIAHNEAGINYSFMQLKEVLSKRPGAKLHVVFGMVKDKDAWFILQLLPKDAVYYFTQPNLPRALEVDELYQLAMNHELRGEKFTSVIDAFSAAKNRSVANDVIYIGGSTFVVAEVI